MQIFLVTILPVPESTSNKINNVVAIGHAS